MPSAYSSPDVVSAHDAALRLLERRVKRWRCGVAHAPFAVAFIVCPAFLTISELRYGNGFIGPGGWLFFGLASCLPMALPVILARKRSKGLGVFGAFWPALGGIVGALPLTLRYAAVNLSSDAQASIALIWGPASSVVWAAGGAAVGLALTFVRPLQFRLPCERALDVLRCRACGYSFTGLESLVCPECGARR